jgi:hypothetical protein
MPETPLPVTWKALFRLSARRGATLRLLLAVLACTSATAVLTAAGISRVTPGIAALANRPSAEAQSVVRIVFRASDCGLSDAFIEQLNAIDATSRVKVVGVMLGAPRDSASRAGLVQELGMRFEVVADERGAWLAAMKRERKRDPLLLLQSRRSLLGEVSPQLLSEYVAFGLSGVQMERER